MTMDEETAPHCLPHDDGVHFWWVHHCTDFAGGVVQRMTVLPAGEDGWTYDPAADTVSPSILCHACGVRGFWQCGEWREVP